MRPQSTPSSKPAIVLPTCPKCGQRMIFTSLEPHDRYSNLDVRFFDCACGETTSDTVARLE